MFQHAYEVASQYTHPVLISHRFFDGKIESGLGSFIILNREGWILTAAHLLEPINVHNKHMKEMEAYKKSQLAIDQHPNLSVQAKLQKKQQNRL